MFVGIGIGINRNRFGGYLQELANAYKARVIADGGDVEALPCFIAFAKSWGAEPIVPVALSATNITSDSFDANWEAVAGASYYLLDVSTNATFTSFVLQNQVVNATTYTVTGLSFDTTYYYRVRAYA